MTFELNHESLKLNLIRALESQELIYDGESDNIKVYSIKQQELNDTIKKITTLKERHSFADTGLSISGTALYGSFLSSICLMGLEVSKVINPNFAYLYAASSIMFLSIAGTTGFGYFVRYYRRKLELLKSNDKKMSSQ